MGGEGSNELMDGKGNVMSESDSVPAIVRHGYGV